MFMLPARGFIRKRIIYIIVKRRGRKNGCGISFNNDTNGSG